MSDKKERGSMTTKKFEAVRELHAKGWNDRKIGERLNVSPYSVRNCRKALGLMPTHSRSRLNVYAVYKDEKLVVSGTAAECSAALGMSKDTFWTTMSLAKHGNYRKYEFVKVEEADNDNI